MKLLMFFLTVACLQVSAMGYSQEVTIRRKNASLEKVFADIYKQTGYQFVYTSDLMKQSYKVNINAQNAPLGDVLKSCFKDQPFTYVIIGNAVVLRRMETEDSPLAEVRLPIKVSGKVTDTLGNPIIGATVKVKEGGVGTVTDVNGYYSMDIQDDAILIISYVGYQTKQVPVSGRNEVNVVLSASQSKLNQLVVVGYGTQKKVNLTGSVDQVTAEQLTHKSVANIGEALQGVVPNLNVSFADGNPAKDPSFNVRGGTSFSGGAFRRGAPLILVDGIPMDINNLNPADIESISILKDAASSAIYGARAAYGVMLITTKKGKRNSNPVISYTVNYQIQKPTVLPKLLNSVEYQEAVMNAQRLNGGTPSQDDILKLEKVKDYFNNPGSAPSYYENNGAVVWVANIDPFKEFLKTSAPLIAHDLSVSGGSEKSNYYVSAGYRDRSGMVALGDDWRKIYNATVGFSTDINRWLNVDSKILYTRSDMKTPNGQGGYSAASDRYFEYLAKIGWRALMNPLWTPASSPVGVMPTNNPLNAFLDNGNVTSQSGNLFARIELTAKIFRGMNFKTNFGYKTIDESQKMFLPSVMMVEKSWIPFSSGHSSVSKVFSKSDYTVYNAYLDFHRTFGHKHDIAAVVGFNQELSQYRSLTAEGNDLVTNAVPVLKLSTGTITGADGESHWAIRGAFTRLNYIFDNKYLLEMNGRYDGTSKFPKGRRFKFFPSISAGWRVSEENFVKDNLLVLSDFKLRASYGSLGNQDVENYAYIASYGLTPQVAYLMDGGRPMAINPPGLVSSDLTWETSTTLNFGADITLWDRLSLTYDQYKRTTSNILTSAEQLPSVLGTSVPNQNTGILETKGWEFSARWTDRLDNGLKYDVSLVVSDNQSKIVKFSGNPHKIFSSLYEGKMMGEIWGFKTQGLFQSHDEISAAPSQSEINGDVWRPGDVRYADRNGDGKITTGSSTVADPGDMEIIGNSSPRYQFGVGMNVAWKGFDFNMFWQGTGKRDYWTGDYLYWGLINGSNINGGTGTPDVYYNSWTPDRPDAFYPAFKPATKNKQVQSRYLLNAAFVRLKNITLGYSLSPTLLRRVKIEKLRIYISGFNVLSLSKVPKFMDPEDIGDTYPLMKSTTLGLQINL